MEPSIGFFFFGEFCLLAIYSSSLYNPNLFGIKGFVVDVYNLWQSQLLEQSSGAVQFQRAKWKSDMKILDQ
jgi:hypothetical protein